MTILIHCLGSGRQSFSNHNKTYKKIYKNNFNYNFRRKPSFYRNSKELWIKCTSYDSNTCKKTEVRFSVLIVLSNSCKLWEIKKTAACSSTDIPSDLREEQFFMLSALHQRRGTMKLINIDHVWRFLLNWQICGANLNRILRIHAQWKEMLRKGKTGQKWSNKL